MFLKIERKEVLQMEWIIGLAGLSFVIGCLCGRSDAAWPFYLIAAAFLVIALFGWWSAIPTALVIWGLVLMALSEKKPEPATTAEKLLGFLSLLWLFRRR